MDDDAAARTPIYLPGFGGGVCGNSDERHGLIDPYNAEQWPDPCYVASKP